MLREPKRLPRYMTPDHFATIYGDCDQATFPQATGYSPGDWWRALLVTAFLTGWRISEILSFRREDLHRDETDRSIGEAILRVENTKGGREERVPLHPMILDHLDRLPGFDDLLICWPHCERFLYDCFAEIQTAAGIHLPCRRNHDHTDACHRYGFHDLRRAFATLNAERITGDALQALMRHQSSETTRRYINVAKQLNRAVADLYQPQLPAATIPVASTASG